MLFASRLIEARTPAFVKPKDQKDNFHSNPTCHLINPSKNELGRLSKQLVEKIKSDIIEKLQFNQWRYTDAVLKWFNNITEKSNCSFIQFDIEEFYLSITKNILHQTLKFAKQHRNINKNDLNIINHCRKSLLFSDNNTLKKKSTDGCFDVTTGSFDGAEICELVGFYIQPKLEKILPKSNCGLHQDNELALLRNLNGEQTDKFRKKIIGVFKYIGFSLEIENNFKEVDFLHVSLNLRNGTYRPYKKTKR